MMGDNEVRDLTPDEPEEESVVTPAPAAPAPVQNKPDPRAYYKKKHSFFD